MGDHLRMGLGHKSCPSPSFGRTTIGVNHG
jgi:hypothetical protein